MKALITASRSNLLLVSILAIFIFSCDSEIQEEVDLSQLLPKENFTEIKNRYPEFKVTLVSERYANVPVMFEDNHLHVDGIDDDGTRRELAHYVVQHLENPNKKEEDRAKKEAYERLSPEEKLASFVERMKSHYPDFDYEWVGAEEGNSKIVYGDNGILIHGVEKEGARQEIAYGLRERQMAIDERNKQEK